MSKPPEPGAGPPNDLLPPEVAKMLKQFVYHFIKDNVTEDPAAFIAYASDYFYNKKNPNASHKNPKENLAPKKMPVVLQPCSGPNAPCNVASNRPQTTPIQRVPSQRAAPASSPQNLTVNPAASPNQSTYKVASSSPLQRQPVQVASQRGPIQAASQRGQKPVSPAASQRGPIQPSPAVSQRGPIQNAQQRISQPLAVPGGNRPMGASSHGLLPVPSAHKTKSNISNASSYNSYQKVVPYVDKSGNPKKFVCCACGGGKYMCHCSSIDDFSELDVTKSEWWLSAQSAMALENEATAQKPAGEPAGGPTRVSIPRNEAEFRKSEEAKKASTTKVEETQKMSLPMPGGPTEALSTPSAPVVSITVPDMQQPS